ncbi:hypothetical protein HHI36_021943 [Cryptolaemus montrouzieri]|uniref:Uncharacterized protein n=1 Tax=Cryptolaemus montrouzieri TaxID=559131 RepID=A0ABD2MYP5_9CUCU
MKVHLLLIGIIFFIATFGEHLCLRCLWCFEKGDTPCRLAKSDHPSCEGKMCYSYMYDLKFGDQYRQSYYRGCTDQPNECSAAGQENCTLCDNKDFCNDAVMPTRGARRNVE